MPEFEGVPEWPELLTDGRDARHDNQPPLEERLAMEFSEDLEKQGVTARVAELLASAAKAPEKIEDTATAGKVGDLIRLAAAVRKRIEEAREKHNRPLLNAQRALKAKADGTDAALVTACTALRQRLNAFMAEESRKADEERQRLAEEARKLQEEAYERASLPEYAPRIEPAKVAAPVARGDLGARVGTRTVWHHEIESVRQLPDRLLKHPKVIDALNIVIAAEIRAMGERKTEIKGVKIWSEKEAAVR